MFPPGATSQRYAVFCRLDITAGKFSRIRAEASACHQAKEGGAGSIAAQLKLQVRTLGLAADVLHVADGASACAVIAGSLSLREALLYPQLCSSRSRAIFAGFMSWPWSCSPWREPPLSRARPASSTSTSTPPGSGSSKDRPTATARPLGSPSPAPTAPVPCHPQTPPQSKASATVRPCSAPPASLTTPSAFDDKTIAIDVHATLGGREITNVRSTVRYQGTCTPTPVSAMPAIPKPSAEDCKQIAEMKQQAKAAVASCSQAPAGQRASCEATMQRMTKQVEQISASCR